MAGVGNQISVRLTDFCDLTKSPMLLELLDLFGILTSVLINAMDLFALILPFIPNYCNGFEFRDYFQEKHMVEDNVLFTNHLAVKVMAKYCVSLDFKPSIMEFSTRQLVLSGCSQFKQVGTRSNQLDLVPVCMI